ncbi:putative aspartokinase [Diplonema papillatum]|nr:putative aspartokinase [Diplonema papillatum]
MASRDGSALKVLKFGGTSVGKDGALEKVAAIVVDSAKANTGIIVVASALSGVTDLLIEAADASAAGDAAALCGRLAQRHVDVANRVGGDRAAEILAQVNPLLEALEALLSVPEPATAERRDLIMSFGEMLSNTILSSLLTINGLSSELCDARSLIATDGTFGAAHVDYNTTRAALCQKFVPMPAKVQCVTGFIGRCLASNKTTTLGRGGGDLTASLIGALLKADAIEVWTDVDGVLTANPRIVSGARVIPTLSYEEAMEMSYFGAKVIYAPTMSPAMRAGVPLKIKNTFNPHAPGTVVRAKPGTAEFKIRAISSVDDITLVVLQGSDMVGAAGVAGRLFMVLANKVNVILISQASSEHSICLAVLPAHGPKAKQLIDTEFAREIETGVVDPVQLHVDLSIIAVVGSQMKQIPGLAGLVTTCLGDRGINIVAIAQGSSELNMSLVVPKSDGPAAVWHIHDAFFHGDTSDAGSVPAPVRNVHVFVASDDGKGWTDAVNVREKECRERNARVKVVGVWSSAGLKVPHEDIVSQGAEQQNELLPGMRVRIASTPELTGADFESLGRHSPTSDSSEEKCARDEEDGRKFFSAILYHARGAAASRARTVLVDANRDSRCLSFYKPLLDAGVTILAVPSVQTSLHLAQSFSRYLLHPRFIWTPSCGFAPSTCAALLALRSSEEDEAVSITLKAAADDLMVPLRALLGSAAGEGPAPQIAFERDEGMRPDTYSIGITTHMEQTTLTARVSGQPTIPQLLRKLLAHV